MLTESVYNKLKENLYYHAATQEQVNTNYKPYSKIAAHKIIKSYQLKTQ